MNSHLHSDLGVSGYTRQKRNTRIGYGAFLALTTLALAGCGYNNHNYYFSPYDVPNSVVIGDFNGDGRMDLAVAYTHIDGNFPNQGYASVILQSSTTAGTFQTGVNYPVGFNPSTIVAGNFNQAGGIDLAVSNANSANVSVLLQSAANGAFSSAVNYSTGGTPFDLASGQLNGDTALDLVVADASSRNNVVVLFQNAATPGTYAAPTLLDVGNLSTAVTVADVNGDGVADIVVANQDPGGNTGRVSIFYGSTTTRGTFLPRVDVAAGTEPIAVKVADVNGDGFPDIIVANEGPGSLGMGTSGVTVLLQNPAAPGTFLPPTTYATARGTVSIALADVNNDGILDIVTANRGGSPSGTVSVLFQDSTRRGIFLTTHNYPALWEPLSVAVGDLNGDGVPDIAIADGARAGVLFNSSATPGTFAAPIRVGQ
jgi:hypothetical protein